MKTTACGSVRVNAQKENDCLRQRFHEPSTINKLIAAAFVHFTSLHSFRSFASHLRASTSLTTVISFSSFSQAASFVPPAASFIHSARPPPMSAFGFASFISACCQLCRYIRSTKRKRRMKKCRLNTTPFPKRSGGGCFDPHKWPPAIT